MNNTKQIENNDILIIDDSAEALKLLEDILTTEGYTVREANNAHLAWRSVREHPPALILLDIKMPEMDGYEFCSRLKAEKKTRAIPVIFCTGLQRRDTIKKGFEVGAVDFINKPFQQEEVVARVQTQLALRRARMELECKNAKLSALNKTLVREIEIRRCAEKALEKSETRYKDAAQIAHLGHWEMDIDTGESIWSDEFFKICGFEPQAFTPTAAKALQLVHPDDRQRDAQQLQTALEGGADYNIEKRIIRSDQSIRSVHSMAVMIRDDKNQPLKLSGVTQDITARKQAEEKVRESERLYKLVLNSARDIVLFHGFSNEGKPGVFIEVNAKACEVLEYSKQELATLTPLDIIDRENLKDIPGEAEVLLKQEQLLFNKNLISKTGKHIPVEISTHLFDYRGQKWAISIARDITARQQRENMLRERVKELQCLYGVSHLVETKQTLTEILDGSVALLVQAWRHPEIATAEIRLYEERRRSRGCCRQDCNGCHYPLMTQPIRVNGQIAGVIRVCYNEERPEADEGPFLKEERSLIKAIAERLGRIAERNHMLRSLQESEETLRLALEATTDGIWDWDIAADEFFYSTAWTQIIGEDSIPPTYASWESRVHPDDRSAFDASLQAHLSGQTAHWRIEHRLRAQPGPWRWVLGQGRVVKRDAHGNPLRMVGILADIEERKNTEKRMVKLAQAAQTANQAKSVFLANMSHEIRTPISALMGFAQILKDAARNRLNSEQVDYLDKILESGERLIYLIDDILDLSKVEAGKMEIAPVLFRLDVFMRRIQHTLISLADKKNLAAQMHTSDDLPKHIIADDFRIEQILRNLINNAVKFTDQGGVEVRLEHPSARKLQFAVCDTGQGIPSDVQPYLFEKFYQADSSYTKKYAGAGLGLAIAKHLTELMGGRIWFESQEGQGSTFYFTLKFDIPQGDAPMAPEVLTDAMPRQRPQRSLKILLAEDDELNRKSIEYFLAQAGHTVASVKNGDEVLAYLQTHDVDIILMDVQMPVKSGVETTEAIRGAENGVLNPHTPIIALTAYAMKGDREKFLGAGMNAYFTKPIDYDALFAKIEQLTGQASPPRETVDARSSAPADVDDDFIQDIQRFMENTKGDPEFLRETLTEYPDDVAARMEWLEKALLSRDVKQIAHASHKFIALFSALYIKSAAKTSMALQNAARTDDLEACERLFHQLKSQMQKIVNYVKRLKVE